MNEQELTEAFYQYLACTQPEACIAVARDNGCDLSGIEDTDGLSAALQHMVHECGTDALMQLAAIHPDKDLLYSLFSQDKGGDAAPIVRKSKKINISHYMQAQSTNTMLLAATIFMASAILTVALVKNK